MRCPRRRQGEEGYVSRCLPLSSTYMPRCDADLRLCTQECPTDRSPPHSASPSSTLLTVRVLRPPRVLCMCSLCRNAVCTGAAVPTTDEFNALARVLDITAAVRRVPAPPSFSPSPPPPQRMLMTSTLHPAAPSRLCPHHQVNGRARSRPPGPRSRVVV